jgi:hypothetical protein
VKSPSGRILTRASSACASGARTRSGSRTRLSRSQPLLSTRSGASSSSPPISSRGSSTTACDVPCRFLARAVRGRAASTNVYRFLKEDPSSVPPKAAAYRHPGQLSDVKVVFSIGTLAFEGHLPTIAEIHRHRFRMMKMRSCHHHYEPARLLAPRGAALREAHCETYLLSQEIAHQCDRRFRIFLAD